ncbi:hypothetical protein K2173_013884 [Erythroxylum novogranatense]|uniref:Maturase K n=1 Tax=Erythroxylum novogranatense TaxID=1862640 RepID=A0AAV8SD46_9ROSI|nr:hypothetical protein K2173_013884 [Erythroxylum novogranatense]
MNLLWNDASTTWDTRLQLSPLWRNKFRLLVMEENFLNSYHLGHLETYCLSFSKSLYFLIKCPTNTYPQVGITPILVKCDWSYGRFPKKFIVLLHDCHVNHYFVGLRQTQIEMERSHVIREWRPAEIFPRCSSVLHVLTAFRVLISGGEMIRG